MHSSNAANVKLGTNKIVTALLGVVGILPADFLLQLISTLLLLFQLCYVLHARLEQISCVCCKHAYICVERKRCAYVPTYIPMYICIYKCV